MASPELRESIGQVLGPVMGSRDGVSMNMGMHLESTYEPGQP